MSRTNHLMARTRQNRSGGEWTQNRYRHSIIVDITLLKVETLCCTKTKISKLNLLNAYISSELTIFPQYERMRPPPFLVFDFVFLWILTEVREFEFALQWPGRHEQGTILTFTPIFLRKMPENSWGWKRRHNHEFLAWHLYCLSGIFYVSYSQDLLSKQWTVNLTLSWLDTWISVDIY